MENSVLEKFIEGYINAITGTCGMSPLTGEYYTKRDIPAEALTLIKAECKIFFKENCRLFDEFIDRGLSGRWGFAGAIFYQVRNDREISDVIPLYFVQAPWKEGDITRACRKVGRFSIKSTTDGKLTFTLGE